jgi:hypothetical protein
VNRIAKKATTVTAAMAYPSAQTMMKWGKASSHLTKISSRESFSG